MYVHLQYLLYRSVYAKKDSETTNGTLNKQLPHR